MNEPTRITLTLSDGEAMGLALEWMRKNYRELLESNPDKYHAMLGIVADFASDLFTAPCTGGEG